MLLTLLKKDIKNKKVMTLILIILMTLSSLLIASAMYVSMTLLGALDEFFDTAKAPHFVQMHAGEIDEAAIDSFVADHNYIQDQQTVKMLNIEGKDIYFKEEQVSLADSIMDNGFVIQNEGFDLLLDLNNEVLHVEEGEIGVPLMYQQVYDLQQGDSVTIKNNELSYTFKIKDFVRDAQMNPSVVSSKRFVIHPNDYERLLQHTGELEYLITFRLDDQEKTNTLIKDYEAAGLPNRGPAVDEAAFKLLNALTEGLVILMIVLLTILTSGIAIVCLKLIITSAIEEDYREIGVMRGIGMRISSIRKVYMTKYVAIITMSCMIGYVGALFLGKQLSQEIVYYMGEGQKGYALYMVPLIAVSAIWLFIYGALRILFRRLNRISAVEALREGQKTNKTKLSRFPNICRSWAVDINVLIGIKDIVSRSSMFIWLLIIFIMSTLVILLPINLVNTVDSPEFITYMGIGKSDLRMDIQYTQDIQQVFEELTGQLDEDEDILRYAPLVTYRIGIQDSEGNWDKLNVETGDLSSFPLEYLAGESPRDETEIALSMLSAQELEVGIGDMVLTKDHSSEQSLRVVGIYQDITNGGKSGKVLRPYQADEVLWYMVNVDLKEDVNLSQKIATYQDQFDEVKVTSIETYVQQTLGETINQLSHVKRIAIIVAITITALLTSLFMGMLLTKDRYEIAVLQSMGFTKRHIERQYMTRVLSVAVVGVGLGTLICNTLGEKLVSSVGAIIGASKISFVINPIQVYAIWPLIFIIIIAGTTRLSSYGVKDESIRESLM